MCGIHLIIDKSNVLDDVPIQQMVKSSSYRGPDGDKWQSFPLGESKIFLGFNYLDISSGDLSAQQPFYKADEDAFLLFNGEIYNTDELKNPLIQSGNIHFQGSSDTEVLYYHLAKKGVKGLTDINGMFALVWVNRSTGELIIARDDSGQKPLFWAETNHFFVASSSVHSILQSKIITSRIQHEQLERLVRYKYVASPDTIYQNIKCLSAGSVLDYSRKQKDIQKITYSPSQQKGEKLLDLIRDAALRHIPQKAPWALFFSGGIDSSLLAATLTEAHIHTQSYYISCGDQSADKWVSFASEKIGISPQKVLFNKDTLLTHFDEFVRDMEYPIADSAAILTWYLSKVASKKAKVIWTGAGADELFSGYRRHQAYYHYLRNPLWQSLGSYLSQFGWHKLFPMNFRKLLEDMTSNPSITFQNFSALYAPGYPAAVDPYLFEGQKDLLKAALMHDRRQYLINDPLMLNDLCGMRSGLEMRAPFLDKELVAWVDRQDSKQLFKAKSKWMLKECLKELGLESIANQPKLGFGLPFDQWIREDKLSVLWESLLDEKAPIKKHLDVDFINLILHLHIKKKQNHGPLLWSLIFTNAWLKHHQ